MPQLDPTVSGKEGRLQHIPTVLQLQIFVTEKRRLRLRPLPLRGDRAAGRVRISQLFSSNSTLPGSLVSAGIGKSFVPTAGSDGMKAREGAPCPFSHSARRFLKKELAGRVHVRLVYRRRNGRLPDTLHSLIESAKSLC